MTRLDPFIIYTIRLVMEQVSNDTSIQVTKNTPYSPTTTAHIMAIQAWPDIQFDKPKLKRGHLLSLLYHADEQWLTSTRELRRLTDAGSTKIKRAVEQVHRQQRIYLDTLHLVQASVFPQRLRRYHEPIWFAAQVIDHQCHVRNLERFTDSLRPTATGLCKAMDEVRLRMRRILQRRRSQEVPFFSFLTRTKTEDDDLAELNLGDFMRSWCQFEEALYDCYVHTVFDKHAPSFLNRISLEFPMDVSMHDIFQDPFTQLLPLALERAMEQGVLDSQSVQSFEPLAFIALPRLAILASVTWLGHLTGWRHTPVLPVWIRAHATSLQRVTRALDIFESELLPNSPLAFVERYRALEQALVSGNQHLQDTNLYLDICQVADSILAGPQAQAFSSVLSHLFRCYVDNIPLDRVLRGEQDALSIEQTILDLAI